MKQFLVFAICLSAASWAWGKCEGLSLKSNTPTKFLVYHTDKYHRTAYEKFPIEYEVESEELSESETLFHISHGKDTDKKCSLIGNSNAKKHTLKQKEYLLVKSASYQKEKFVMVLDDDEFKSIECTGVSTMQDLKDVLEPYLVFTCKDKVAYSDTRVDSPRDPASFVGIKRKK